MTTRTIPEMGQWRYDAACAGHPPDVFFPDPFDRATTKAAKAICANCPVAQPCLDEALAEEIQVGIRGGRTVAERSGFRPERAARGLQGCGTQAGYDYHRRHGERPCFDCGSAHRVYVAERHAVRRGLARAGAAV